LRIRIKAFDEEYEAFPWVFEFISEGQVDILERRNIT
jgi:hypothetical protein